MVDHAGPGQCISQRSMCVTPRRESESARHFFAGSYPWYFTFNFLQQALPKQDELVLKLLRNAACGFGATCVSDVTSNFIRVLKTTVQTSAEPISYVEAAQQIIEKEGVLGLFARGLGTRLLTNGIQASLFSVLWKLFEDMFANKGL